MAELLLHSMSSFSKLIFECFACAGVQRVIEIGTEHGGMSTAMAEWLCTRDGSLTCIDPLPKPAFLNWLGEPGAAQRVVVHVAKPSLEALPELPCADAWLIDGDHNWYTVFHELREILCSCQQAQTHPLIFLHDVGWPCGERDLYYAPERIPNQFLHPHRFDCGVTLESPSLLPDRGFRGAGSFAWATKAGGPRNGVMRAVKDALAEARRNGQEYGWCFVPAVFGLGVIYSRSAPWSEAMETLLHPWHGNELLAELEGNRLLNFLHVLEMHDIQKEEHKRQLALAQA